MAALPPELYMALPSDGVALPPALAPDSRCLRGFGGFLELLASLLVGMRALTRSMQVATPFSHICFVRVVGGAPGLGESRSPRTGGISCCPQPFKRHLFLCFVACVAP